MAIKLPERQVATRDKLRSEYVAQHGDVLARVTRSIERLCRQHRKPYEAFLFDQRKGVIQRFIDSRRPNETAYDAYLAPHRQWIDSLATTLQSWSSHEQKHWQKLDAEAKHWAGYVAKYTTHPYRHNEYGMGERSPQDFPDRRSYESWLEDTNRAAFAVAWRTTADTTIKEEISKQVDHIVSAFIEKTVDKVADILIARAKYECALTTGTFSSGMFEGDLKLTFPNGTGFRTHVILKTNYTMYGDPYAQYPLTFHDVVGKKSSRPSAMLSQEEVYELLGVPKWAEPKRQKNPWTIVKIGDVLQTKTMANCICIGTRGDTATVFHPDNGEETVTADDIVAILARTSCDTCKKPFCVRVEQFDGVTFSIEVPRSAVAQYDEYAFGTKVGNTMRKACSREILERVRG